MIRAGILITGTEVLSGAVTDRNGPWLSQRLQELGVEAAHICTVGDRPRDVQAALAMMREQALQLIVTSGGLGPTADDLTVATVAAQLGIALVLDEALQQRIEQIVSRIARRTGGSREAFEAGNRKQATVPAGATVIDPVGTAPGLVIELPAASQSPATGAAAPDGAAPDGGSPDGGSPDGGSPDGGSPDGGSPDGAAPDGGSPDGGSPDGGSPDGGSPDGAAPDGGSPDGGSPDGGSPDGGSPDGGSPDGGSPIVVVLPGPPRELQPMWDAALLTPPLKALLTAAGEQDVRTMRLYGVPESLLAQTLRDAQDAGVPFSRLEVTTCQHRGELEITTRVPVEAGDDYAAFERFLAERHGEALFSTDGASIDERVAALLRGHETVAVAESCTGGMLAARLTDLAGSSEYVRGGIVAYSNDAKVSSAGVPRELIEAQGAVSQEVAAALAQGARETLGAGVGVGITGIAGPGGATDGKPVGLVWLAVAGPGSAQTVRSVQLPGGRPEVRERAVTVAMHMLRGALEGTSSGLSR